ncbi:MAG: protein-L-isoaspartate O-methyltransferase [Thermoprotei archaeon]|nr:MAG: protein-L-isoaspartate O-methyltransferase [Thermoprotei archaeon]
MDYSLERKRLVEKLIMEGIIRSEKVKNAMLNVPREEFVPPHQKRWAYVDHPLPIGHGQTISAPHMVAIMTELLNPEPGHIVLEIGTGSGYQAAVLAEIVSKQDPMKKGHVYTIERISELAKFAMDNLKRTGYSDYVTVIISDGTKGYSEKSPYDRIIVTAAAPTIPKPLIEQLRPGGIMVIPVGDLGLQRLLIVHKSLDGKLNIKEDTWCLFVPLIGEYGWKDHYYY